MCLIEEAPIIKITEGFDKMGHLTFHFGIVLLWFLYFKVKFPLAKNFTNLRNAYLISLFFGISLEICQAIFTKTRIADIMDVFANAIGGAIAVVLVWLGLKQEIFRRIKNGVLVAVLKMFRFKSANLKKV